MKAGAAILAALLLVPRMALADSGNVSASVWTNTGADIVLSYTIPASLASVLGTPGAPAPSAKTLGHYILSKLSVQRQNVPCDAVDQGYDLGRIDTRYVGADLISFEVLFRCAGPPGPLLLRNDAFLERSPGNIGIASARMTGLPPSSRLIAAGHATLLLGGGQPASQVAASVGLGIRHIMGGMVRLWTALGLLLLIRERNELPRMAGGLVAGYLCATIASTAGWFLDSQAARAFEALLLLVIGAVLVARCSGRPPAVSIGLALIAGIAAAVTALLGHGNVALCLLGAGSAGCLTVVLTVPARRALPVARWLAPALAALVGMSDGMFLSSSFAPLHPVASPDWAQLLGFNVGALLATASIVAGAAAARAVLRRQTRFEPRRFSDVINAALIAVGAFSILTM